jgi:hypothetical protein
MTSREERQQAFIRVCRDSGFSLESSRAASLAAKVLGIHPLDIWVAIGDLATMDRIACGEHPAARAASPNTKG